MYRTLLTIITLCSIVVSGCELFPEKEPLDVSFIKTRELRESRIRRIVVIPLAYVSDRDEVIKEVTEAIAMELQKTGEFDIVMPDKNLGVLLEGTQLWGKGTIKSEVLVEARRLFGADAIISGTITHYKPHKPLVLGLKLGMINTNTGSLLWNFDGVFDSNDTKVTQMVMDYYKQSSQGDASIYGWEIMLLSMRKYTQFVANHVVSTLKR